MIFERKKPAGAGAGSGPGPGQIGRGAPRMPIDLVSRAPYWQCSNCDARFRVFNGKEPVCCPLCGILKAKTEAADLPEPDIRTYTCPYCGCDMDVFGVRRPKCCPGCGGEL